MCFCGQPMSGTQEMFFCGVVNIIILLSRIAQLERVRAMHRGSDLRERGALKRGGGGRGGRETCRVQGTGGCGRAYVRRAVPHFTQGESKGGRIGWEGAFGGGFGVADAPAPLPVRIRAIRYIVRDLVEIFLGSIPRGCYAVVLEVSVEQRHCSLLFVRGGSIYI